MNFRILEGDCVAVMATLAANSIDAIVTDPPYHLTTGKKGGTGKTSDNPNSPAGRARISTGFMGKGWDGGDVAFRPETWAAVLRVAKPGAHLVAFGGTRTYHRLTCAIEDAGWEIRDCLSWLYGSGFPKSLDVSKAIDKAAGAEREVLERRGRKLGGGTTYASDKWSENARLNGFDNSITAPATDAAKRWHGWGTALKPAWEPIVLARKPLGQTVATNVQEHGTGALNVDGCRIESGIRPLIQGPPKNGADAGEFRTQSGFHVGDTSQGRWPANVVLDEDAAALLDEHSGTLTSGARSGARFVQKFQNAYGAFNGGVEKPCEASEGGASRFFYTAKASRSEREAGLEHHGKRRGGSNAKGYVEDVANGVDRNRPVGNHHPTVKPLDLMQWLCRLVTQKGGLILDPFCGSGSTGRAAVAEGFAFIGIELDPEYAAIARARIADYAPLFHDPEAA